MKKLAFLLFIILVQGSWAGGEEEDFSPKEITYPEKKYYEKSYTTREKTHDLLESLYLKKPAIDEEVDLRKIEETFFRKGTGEEKEMDYLKEAEKNRWEEWSPFFYEFGKALKREGKEIFHQWLFPKKSEIKESLENK